MLVTWMNMLASEKGNYSGQYDFPLFYIYHLKRGNPHSVSDTTESNSFQTNWNTFAKEDFI